MSLGRPPSCRRSRRCVLTGIPCILAMVCITLWVSFPSAYSRTSSRHRLPNRIELRSRLLFI